MKIGFFDSGVGGFYVMERVMRHLPQYDYVFYGDTKHLPYGDKKESEIYRLTRNALWYLFSAHDAYIVIVACNTASAETLRKIQDQFIRERYPERRALGVIVPTVETIIEQNIQAPLIIGTTRTIVSQKYERELEKISQSIKTTTQATPHLVPLIEAGKFDEAVLSLDDLIYTHRENGGDSVVLACTHYGLLTDRLRSRHAGLHIIAQEEIIPHKLESYLKRHPEIEIVLGREGNREVVWS